jgi:hypothetical protein
MLHAAAQATLREKRMVARVRPVCAHNGFTNEEMHRFARFAYGAWPTKEEAVRAVVMLCRGDGMIDARKAKVGGVPCRF